MKETSIENFRQDIEGFLHAAQCEWQLVTQEGKPLAVLVGVENKDQEDWDQILLRPFIELEMAVQA